MRGPKTDPKSPLNYLSGENYQATDSIMGVTVVDRKARSTEISGSVVGKVKDISDGAIGVPLRNIQVALLTTKGQKIAETITTEYGDFKFSVPLQNGTYQLAVDTQKYVGSRSIEVTSYELHNLALEVASKIPQVKTEK